MDSFSFTENQRKAIFLTLAASLKDADQWPTYLNAIERVVRLAVYKANRDVEKSPLYATQAAKRLGKLREALNRTIQCYGELGLELQLYFEKDLLLHPELSASLTPLEQSTAKRILSSDRFPRALESLAEATNQCAVSLNYQPFFPKTGAPREHAAFQEAVHALMMIFEQATGGMDPTVYSSPTSEEGYDGTFYHFAVAVLRPACLVRPKSFNSALLAAYTSFNNYLKGKQPRKKKTKKKKSNNPPA